MAVDDSSTDTARIVVGVDGSTDALRAVRFAVREARRRGCELRLVHVQHGTAPLTPMLPLVSSETLEEAGRRALSQAESEVRLGSGSAVGVQTVTLAGPVVRTLLAESHDAAMIVVGHRDASALGRLVTAHTAVGLAARSDRPVVAVPAAWRHDHELGVVVAAVDGSSASREVLAAGFAAASARGATLRVLHAWRVPLAYDDLLDPVDAEPRWKDESAPVIAEVLAGWRTEYPEVDVEVELRYQRTADALVHASTVADLLVVGRHGHGDGIAGRTTLSLGSLARTVLHHAHCPVEVAPHHEDLHRETATQRTRRARPDVLSAPLY